MRRFWFILISAFVLSSCVAHNVSDDERVAAVVQEDLPDVTLDETVESVDGEESVALEPSDIVLHKDEYEHSPEIAELAKLEIPEYEKPESAQTESRLRESASANGGASGGTDTEPGSEASGVVKLGSIGEPSAGLNAGRPSVGSSKRPNADPSAASAEKPQAQAQNPAPETTATVDPTTEKSEREVASESSAVSSALQGTLQPVLFILVALLSFFLFVQTSRRRRAEQVERAMTGFDFQAVPQRASTKSTLEATSAVAAAASISSELPSATNEVESEFELDSSDDRSNSTQ